MNEWRTGEHRIEGRSRTEGSVSGQRRKSGGSRPCEERIEGWPGWREAPGRYSLHYLFNEGGYKKATNPYPVKGNDLFERNELQDSVEY